MHALRYTLGMMAYNQVCERTKASAICASLLCRQHGGPYIHQCSAYNEMGSQILENSQLAKCALIALLQLKSKNAINRSWCSETTP